MRWKSQGAWGSGYDRVTNESLGSAGAFQFTSRYVIFITQTQGRGGEGRERKDFLFPSPVASSLSPDGNNMSAKVLKVRRLKCVCTVGK